MARPWLAIGGIALIGIGVAIGLGWWWPSTAHATARVDAPVRTVEVANDSGDVTIRAADVARTTVRQRFEYNWDEPDSAYRVSDGVLTLNGCGHWCSVNYEVTVPRGATVTGSVDSGDLSLEDVASTDVHVDSGSISISGVAGAVTAEADSGDIELRDIGGKATVNADSGSVSGTGLRGPVRAQLSSGDLEVRMAQPANVRAEVDSGNIEITVPRGAEYRVEGDTDSGDRQIDVRRDSSAAHLLRLHSSSGDVTVNTAG